MTPPWCRAVVIAVVVLLVAVSCRTIDPLDDTRIEAEVKARLVGETHANLTRLGVVSRGGIVYLSGAVASPDEKSRAEKLASGVRGVRRVVNTVHAGSGPN